MFLKQTCLEQSWTTLGWSFRVKVYSYGKTTTTDDGGNWTTMKVTGVNINSTPQNLEQTTDVVSQGKIYISYSRTGYAEYRSSISNPAVVTHYGTAGGNPNSIIVDGLMVSEAIQLPQRSTQLPVWLSTKVLITLEPSANMKWQAI